MRLKNDVNSPSKMTIDDRKYGKRKTNFSRIARLHYLLRIEILEAPLVIT